MANSQWVQCVSAQAVIKFFTAFNKVKHKKETFEVLQFFLIIAEPFAENSGAL